ncbi:MAG TPA: DNA mismatch repair endonuclease MutL [Thermoanaerobaculia bacterium]|nr:DNA mismatch repair endonuclease MutL [Thermoanaerobaculia bacterium]
MAKIHLLADPLVSQIAAGEVVERPASVVKELVENALDAGAEVIEVELEGGGRSRIAVADDGCGMGSDDALLAFDRHATSKIASFADLERVGTLGFRGEALAAISAVARVELTTAEQPGAGHRVRLEGGRVRLAEPCARPRGTTLEVRSLFFNVPARRKFLKAQQTELRRALEVVQGYALARPEVRFRLAHEGRTLLDALPAAGGARLQGLRERIGQIFGAELAAHLEPIAAPGAAGEPAGPGGADTGREWIGGFVGLPETARGGQRGRQLVFVNRRLLRDRAVLATFYRAVREQWRSEDFPPLFLFLDLPPEEVDVNVHPQKAEVRFRDPALLERIGEVLRGALDRARGEVAAPLRAPAAPRPEVPFAWQGLGGGGSSSAAWPGAPAGGELPVEVREATPQQRLASPAFTPLATRPVVPLSGRRGEVRPFRLLGQYKGTLILLEGPDGLYLVDQHVAHERILFERLRRALAAERTPVQILLTPALLALAPAERLRLLELAAGLEECGFSLAALSGSTLALTAVPAALAPGEAEALLVALAAAEPEGADGPDGGGDPAGAVGALRRRVLDALAAGLACKAAVKMHHPLSPLEMEALVGELFAADQPFACPHGRPIVLQMTDSDLERRFGRR